MVDVDDESIMVVLRSAGSTSASLLSLTSYGTLSNLPKDTMLWFLKYQPASFLGLKAIL